MKPYGLSSVSTLPVHGRGKGFGSSGSGASVGAGFFRADGVIDGLGASLCTDSRDDLDGAI